MIKSKCENCGVWTTDIKRHLERDRCEAVENRRLYRKEIKQKGNNMSVVGTTLVLGPRGERTLRREGKTLNKKGR